MLAVPLLREGLPIGVLHLLRTVVRPFTDKQIELIETFADQAVIAVENVRLFDEVQARTRELSESLEQQTATSEVLGVISSSPGELEPVFQTMLANAVRICEASFGNLLFTTAMHSATLRCITRRRLGLQSSNVIRLLLVTRRGSSTGSPTQSRSATLRTSPRKIPTSRSRRLPVRARS
jgi:hypothetical protein